LAISNLSSYPERKNRIGHYHRRQMKNSRSMSFLSAEEKKNGKEEKWRLRAGDASVPW